MRIPIINLLKVRSYSTTTNTSSSSVGGCIKSIKSKSIKIVEVGPRDGLQNEKSILSKELKVELIERLIKVGIKDVESGSFVSPKWIPQMATTTAVLSSPTLHTLRSLHPDTLSLPVLVPNMQGFQAFQKLLALPSPLPSNSSLAPVPITNEIAIFISASEAFSKANLNCTISESIDRLIPVVELALSLGIKVRGYISVVIGCPFEGKVQASKVEEVARRLVEMGCYEISLGDTIGVGTPLSWNSLIEVVAKKIGVEKLAAHCHDSFGTGVANILSVVELGVTTVDTSISGLGGCPYSPGATGNVATEDVIYALESSGYTTGILPLPYQTNGKVTGEWDDLLDYKSERGKRFEELAEVGGWVSGMLGRENGSRAGKATLARRDRRRKLEAGTKL